MGSPKFIAAPMVDQSECAFRMLNRQYGTELCYTPMLHSRMMVEQKSYKELNFWSHPEDKPLVA
jgi:tRNA-dihydrouridine synthase